MIRTSRNQRLFPLLIIGLLLTLAACDLLEEPKIPTWTNTVEFPITRQVVSLEDLEDEENIQTQLYDGDGSRQIFAYVDTVEMDTQSIEDQLVIDDIHNSFSQTVDDVTVNGSSINQSTGFDPVGVDPIEKNILSELGVITLDDIPADTTDPFLLNEVVPSVDSVPEGSKTVIDSIGLEPVEKPFTFSDFESAVFSNGILDVTINNNMVIALGNPINIQLKTAGQNIDGALITWDTPIDGGSTSTKSLNLTGLTLPGDIVIEVTGSTIGSNGDSLVIDAAAKTSSFDIVISGRDLQVSRATAKVPAQTVDETGSITMAASENKVQEALISTGTLAISVDNQMEVDSKLILSIQSLKDADNNVFVDSVDLPGNAQTDVSFPVSGYSMVMDINDQKVDYSYQIRTIDTGDDFVTLDQSDQVDVTISLYGATETDDISFSEITGIIESQLVTENGDIDVSSDSKILNAAISNGSISISIDNQINKPGYAGLPTLTLTIPEILYGPAGSALTRVQELQPGTNLIPIDLSGHYLTFPDTSTQILTYQTEVTTPVDELGRYGLEDSIFVDINVGDLQFSSVTGYFTQDALVDSNTIELDEGTKLVEALFNSGEIIISIDNHIGVEADVDFTLDEFVLKSDPSESLHELIVLTASSETQQTTIPLDNYMLKFDDASPGVNQFIHYVSKVSIPSDREMTLTFGDNLDINVDIRNLELESVTGIIEPDTLELDPTEQEIDMPDMVEDLMFEKVNIDIDFDTDISIPIFLTLNLSGTASDGSYEETGVSNWNITDSSTVHIDGADLLNIHPETIISTGYAVVGDGQTTGTVAQGQSLASRMLINVPLSLIIDNPPLIEEDPEFQEAMLDLSDTVSVEEVVIFSDVINQFEFGASVVVLVSTDSLAFDSVAISQQTAPPSDTLMTFEVLPFENMNATGEHDILEIVLDKDKIELLEEDLFIKSEIQLLGQDDGSPSRFFTTDSMTIRTWGRISYMIHGDEL